MVLLFIYVFKFMFPAATAAPFTENVVLRGVLAIFVHIQVLLGLAKFSVSVTGRVGTGVSESRRLKGELRFGPHSTIDASAFPPIPSRSDWVPPVSHVLIKV